MTGLGSVVGSKKWKTSVLNCQICKKQHTEHTDKSAYFLAAAFFRILFFMPDSHIKKISKNLAMGP